MGNEIAYHDISCAHQIQNFLKQGGAVSLQPPPGGQLPGPLRTPRSQSVLPAMTPMHKRYERGRGCGVGGAEWGLRHLLPFFDDSWGKWATRGNLQLVTVEAWNPGMESLVEMVQTREFITKLCEFYPRRKQVFLDFWSAKTYELPGLCTLDPRQVVKQILISIVVQVGLHEGMIMIVAYAGGSSLVYPKGGSSLF